MNKLLILGTLLVVAEWVPTALSQNQQASSSKPEDNALRDLAGGLQQFAIDLLLETSLEAPPMENLVLSPYSVWTVFVLIMEGSAGNTANQIRSTLHLPESLQSLRTSYGLLDKALKVNNKNAEVESLNGIFSDINRPAQREYELLASRYYRTTIFPVNFGDRAGSAKLINNWVANSTRYRITNLVHPDDLINPQLLLANAVFFRGMWDKPFNASNTFVDKFYTESGTVLTNVHMMYQSGEFLYSYVDSIGAHVLELPYGGDKFSMLLMLPKAKAPIVNVLKKMKTVSLDSIYEHLIEVQKMYEGEPVDVYLPRISVQSDFVLNVILEKMGIVDAFSATDANLPGISSHQIYISKLIHKAEVEITEEGTVASSATGAGFVNKMKPPQFHANRPFAYFIIEKHRRLVLFSGIVSNPGQM